MSKKTLVLIDDDDDLLTIARIGLAGKGYNVHVTTNPVEGIKLIKKILPDAVILDIIMPGMNGYDVCHTLKADKATQKIPVIMLTSKDTISDIDKGFDAGADFYLTKPFSLTAVIRKLTQAFPTKEKHEEAWLDNLIQKIRLGEDIIPLGKIADIYQGILPGTKNSIKKEKLENYEPIILPDDIHHHYMNKTEHFIDSDPSKHMRVPDKKAYLAAEKLLVRIVAPPILAAVDTTQAIFENGIYSIIPGRKCPNIYYLSGLLNSKLFLFVWRHVLDIPTRDGETYLHIRPMEIKSFPIKIPTPDQYKEISGFVKTMAEGEESLDSKHGEGTFKKLLHQLDQKIMELYKLNDDECKKLDKMTIV